MPFLTYDTFKHHIIYNPNKRDNMKAPKEASKDSSKKKDWQAHLVLLKLKSWQGRIVELASKPAYKAYKKWFIKNK